MRISYYSYWEEKASFPCQRSLGSMKFCLCFKGLLLFGSCKSCIAVSTEPGLEFAGKIPLAKSKQGDIISLQLYNNWRYRDFCRLQENWLWCTKTHETVLQGFGVMLTYKDICPTSCLPPWISSQPLDSSYQNVHYLKGDIVSTMKNMSYWCIKFYSNVSWDKGNLSVPNFIYTLPETLTVGWYKLSDKFD